MMPSPRALRSLRCTPLWALLGACEPGGDALLEISALPERPVRLFVLGTYVDTTAPRGAAGLGDLGRTRTLVAREVQGLGGRVRVAVQAQRLYLDGVRLQVGAAALWEDPQRGCLGAFADGSFAPPPGADPLSLTLGAPVALPSCSLDPLLLLQAESGGQRLDLSCARAGVPSTPLNAEDEREVRLRGFGFTADTHYRFDANGPWQPLRWVSHLEAAITPRCAGPSAAPQPLTLANPDGTLVSACLRCGAAALSLTLHTQVPIPTSAGVHLLPADMNGDGAADLVLHSPSSVRVLRGDGAGGFAVGPAVALVVPELAVYSQAPTYLVANDSDRARLLDGNLSLVSTSPIPLGSGYVVGGARGGALPGIVVRPGGGAPRVWRPARLGQGAVETLPFDLPGEPIAFRPLVRADREDLLVRDPSLRFLYLSSWPQSSIEPRSYPLPSNFEQSFLWDGDGDGVHEVYVLYGMPPYRQLALLRSESGGEPTLQVVSLNPFELGPPQQAQLADFDLDGAPEVAFLFTPAGRGRLLNVSSLTRQRTWTSGLSRPAASPFAIADFNGDGLPDIALLLEDSDHVAVLINTSR